MIGDIPIDSETLVVISSKSKYIGLVRDDFVNLKICQLSLSKVRFVFIRVSVHAL